MKGAGKVSAILRIVEPGQPAKIVMQAITMANYGLQGDYRSGRDARRQLLVVDEALEEAAGLWRGDLREHLLVRGLKLSSLRPGTRLKVGALVFLEVTEPLRSAELHWLTKEAREALGGIAGVWTRVEVGGMVHEGDPVLVLPTQEPREVVPLVSPP